jgi:Protein of unknown function (DUF3108)
MQKTWSRSTQSRPVWQSLLMVLVCIALHWFALRVFVSQSAFIEARPDWRKAPVQIEILAEPPARPSDPPAQQSPEAQVAKKPSSKPIYRPRPPRPATPSAKPTPGPTTEPTAAPPASSDSTTSSSADSVNSADRVDTAVGPAEASPAPAASADSSAAALAGRPVSGDKAEPARSVEPPRLLIGKALPPPPPSGRWSYSIHMGDFEQTGSAASLKLGFENYGTAYTLRTEISATGLTALFYGGIRRDFSRGRITANGFEPERYAEQRSKGGERATLIDYARQQIQFAGGDVADYPEGLQDRLSSLFQLGLLARAQPELFTAGKTVEIPELNLRDVEKIRYVVDGPAELKTALGVLRTLHLTRQPGASGKDPEIELWLDYDFGMLPVRIRLTDASGRVIDQVIDSK